MRQPACVLCCPRGINVPALAWAAPSNTGHSRGPGASDYVFLEGLSSPVSQPHRQGSDSDTHLSSSLISMTPVPVCLTWGPVPSKCECCEGQDTVPFAHFCFPNTQCLTHRAGGGINKYLLTEALLNGPGCPEGLGSWALCGRRVDFWRRARSRQAPSPAGRGQLRLLFVCPTRDLGHPEHRTSRSSACEAYTIQSPDSPRQTHKLPT